MKIKIELDNMDAIKLITLVNTSRAQCAMCLEHGFPSDTVRQEMETCERIQGSLFEQVVMGRPVTSDKG